MAERRGLIRKVRLLLDRKSARKVAKDSQKALDKGTDPKKAKRNIKEVEGSFDRLKKVAVKVGAVLASLWAVKKVVEYGKAIFNLGSSVLAVGSQFDTVFGDRLGRHLRERTEELRLMAGLTRRQSEELLAGAGSMAQGFGMAKDASADFAQEVLELSADLASFNNVPTAQAAQLVQSALIGNTEAARSLKVSFTALDVTNRALAMTGKASAKELTQEEKALAGLAVMTERAGPMIGDLNRTQNDSDNVAKQLAGSYAQVKESLAAVLVESTAGELGLTRIRDAFRDLDHWVTANAEQVGAWASITIQTVVTVFKTVGRAAVFLKNTVELVVDVLTMVSASAIGTIVSIVSGAIDAINGMISLANRIPLVDIPLLVNNQDPQKWFRLAAEAAREFAKDSAEGGNAIIGVGKDWLQWGRDVQAAKQLASEGGGAEAPADPPATGGEGGSLPMPTIGLAGTGLTLDLSIPDSVRASMREDVTWMEQNWAAMESVGINAAMGVSGAWQDAFALIAQEGETVGSFFEAVGAGMAGAMLGGIAEFAAGKVAQNIAWGIEKIAMGLGFAATGNFPSAALAEASAGQHFAAAAGWGVLAGGAGAAQSAVAGGNRGGLSGGVPTGARDIGGRIADRQNTAPEINIFIDPLDPNDPAWQENVGAAVQRAQDRFGSNARINVRPRSGRGG